MDKTVTQQAKAGTAQKALNAVWPVISTKKAHLFLISGIVAIGIYFNWGWFVAVGVAPLILVILPCAVICSLALCMPAKNGSCSSGRDHNSNHDIDSDNRN